MRIDNTFVEFVMPPFQTHQVDNQPPEFAPRDLWADDIALREALAREGGEGWTAQVAAYGALAGDEVYRLSFDAHRDQPRLRSFDGFGHRIDRVEFHPNYHRIMQLAIEHGVAGLSWADPRPGVHVARAALSYLHSQAEPGSSCPLTMTHAAIPVLRHAPVLREWADKAAAAHYDPREAPIAAKRGVTLGMGMTEKQGGSDVRANTTTATPTSVSGEYRLVGHKWFLSAPMSDGFLVLGQAANGLTCFLLPRRLPDGGKNAFALMRLKDKLGDWSNASSEVELHDAIAWRVGEEGRGIATILEMVMLTRLDCMLGSAAQMRMALAQAIHHCAHRRAFGKRLVEQPLMRQVLGDLILESEAATALAMRIARSFDESDADPGARAFSRLATPIAKFWLNKRLPELVYEAMECHGGAGYIEENVLARVYRAAPLNSIWEGSGNVICLDVLRAMAREPESLAALIAELSAAKGGDAHYDRFLATLLDEFAPGRVTEAGARRLCERLGVALQASVLLREAPSFVAEAFCASRLADEGRCYGSLPVGVEVGALIERARPQV